MGQEYSLPACHYKNLLNRALETDRRNSKMITDIAQNLWRQLLDGRFCYMLS